MMTHAVAYPLGKCHYSMEIKSISADNRKGVSFTQEMCNLGEKLAQFLLLLISYFILPSQSNK